MYHPTFVLTDILGLLLGVVEENKTKKAYVLLIRSTSQTGSLGNYMPPLSQHGWCCGSLQRRRKQIEYLGPAAKKDGRALVRYTVGGGSCPEKGLNGAAVISCVNEVARNSTICNRTLLTMHVSVNRGLLNKPWPSFTIGYHIVIKKNGEEWHPGGSVG